MSGYIDGHLALNKPTDLVLLANYPKGGIGGYIVANSLMEAAYTYALGVSVAYLNPVGKQPCRLEALSISQSVIGKDIREVVRLFELVKKSLAWPENICRRRP